MELFDFESDGRAIKAREEYKNSRVVDDEIVEPEDGQSILQLIITIVIGVILVILLVLLGRWIYHKVHHAAEVTTTSSNQPATQSSRSASSQTQPNPSSSSNSQSSSTSSSNANPSSSSTLPNNGPGNTIAIFAASTLAAAGLHYIISLRRFNKND